MNDLHSIDTCTVCVTYAYNLRNCFKCASPLFPYKLEQINILVISTCIVYWSCLRSIDTCTVCITYAYNLRNWLKNCPLLSSLRTDKCIPDACIVYNIFVCSE